MRQVQKHADHQHGQDISAAVDAHGVPRDHLDAQSADAVKHGGIKHKPGAPPPEAFCFRFFAHRYQKPPVLSDRGRRLRGTTSGSPPPRGKRSHAVPSHGSAVTGAPGARLLSRRAVWVPAPRCSSAAVLSPFHHTGVLLAESIRLLLRIIAVTGFIVSDFPGNVNPFMGARRRKSSKSEYPDTNRY